MSHDVHRSTASLSVGIIGAGNVVRGVHLPVLLALDGVSVAWITDRDRAVAREVSARFGVTAVDLPESPSDLPPAGVYLLAIPYGARDPFYEALSARGAAVYIEKPVALDRDEHRRITDGFDPWRMGVGLQRRSFGPTLRIREIVRSEPFGPLRSIHCAMGRPGGGRYSGFRSQTRGSRAGILFEHGIHLLDSVLFLTAAESIDVHEVTMDLECGLDVHTQARSTLRRAAGADVGFSFEFSWLTETRNGVALEFERARLFYSIYDDGGRIEARPLDGDELWLVRPEHPDLYPLTPAQVLHEHWRLFLDGVRSHEANYTAGVNCLLTTEAVENCYRLGQPSTEPLVQPR